MTLSDLMADCIQCGQCRDVCLAEQLGGHTITSLLNGSEDFSAWLCSCCWLCQEVCPEYVDIHAVMIDVRRAEPPTPSYRRALQSILESGHAFPITARVNDLRRDYGLPPVEPIRQDRLSQLRQWLECDIENVPVADSPRGHAETRAPTPGDDSVPD